MKEILFKAKRIDNGEWVQGSIHKNYIITYLEKNQFLHEYDLFNCKCVIHVIDPKTICQYTGLKDKKGCKIFSNDIVSFNYNSVNVKYVVDYENVCFVAIRSYKNNNYLYHFNDISEIIGNIHDN